MQAVGVRGRGPPDGPRRCLAWKAAGGSGRGAVTVPIKCLWGPLEAKDEAPSWPGLQVHMQTDSVSIRRPLAPCCLA